MLMTSDVRDDDILNCHARTPILVEHLILKYIVQNVTSFLIIYKSESNLKIANNINVFGTSNKDEVINSLTNFSLNLPKNVTN